MDKATITAIVSAILAGWSAYRAPATSEVAPVAARVEALAVDVEWLKYGHCRQVAQDEPSGPPANLAPLPRLGR